MLLFIGNFFCDSSKKTVKNGKKQKKKHDKMLKVERNRRKLIILIIVKKHLSKISKRHLAGQLPDNWRRRPLDASDPE
jgi:hypothetical protein